MALIKLSFLFQVIDETRRSFRLFFKWLHAEILKLSDDVVPEYLAKTSQQEIAFIAEFLASFDIDEEEEEEQRERKDKAVKAKKSSKSEHDCSKNVWIVILKIINFKLMINCCCSW